MEITLKCLAKIFVLFLQDLIPSIISCENFLTSQCENKHVTLTVDALDDHWRNSESFFKFFLQRGLWIVWCKFTFLCQLVRNHYQTPNLHSVVVEGECGWTPFHQIKLVLAGTSRQPCQHWNEDPRFSQNHSIDHIVRYTPLTVTFCRLYTQKCNLHVRTELWQWY